MKRYALVLLAALIFSPAKASDGLDETTLGLAWLQWGWINCPAGVVSDDNYQFANGIISEMDQDEIKPYWDAIREVAKTAGGTAATCTALADRLKATKRE